MDNLHQPNHSRFHLEHDSPVAPFATTHGVAPFSLLTRYVSANPMNATFIGGGAHGWIDAFRPNDRDLVDLPIRSRAPRSNQRDCHLSILMCLANAAGSSVTLFTLRGVFEDRSYWSDPSSDWLPRNFVIELAWSCSMTIFLYPLLIQNPLVRFIVRYDDRCALH